MQSKKVMLLAW